MSDWFPPLREVPSEVGDFPPTGRNSLARLGPRAVARAIDSLLIGLPVLLVGSAAIVLTDQGADAELPRWVSLMWFVLVVVYEGGLVAWHGQTLGKMLMGLKVGRLDNGRPPVWWQAGMRVALPAASACLPFHWAVVIFAGIYATSGGSPLRRGLHDHAAGTVVVSTR